MNALRQPVMKLNKKWLVLKDITTAQVALENMCRGAEMGIDMDIETGVMRAVGWDEWITLPIRDHDHFVNTVRGKVRVPRVVLCVKYAGREMVKPPERPSNADIRKRDKCICQITGEYAPDGNVDHDVPVSRNGKETWENKRWMKRELNQKKSNRTLAEMNWNPIRPAVKPEPLAPEQVIEPVFPEWGVFLKKRRN